MQSSLLDLLNKYQAFDDAEQQFQQRIIDFIKNYPDNHFDRNNTVGHITGSTWILNHQRDKTLLTHHRKLDRWLQIGGHAEGETDIFQVCLREAKEESGLRNLKMLHPEIFTLDIHRIPEHKGFPAHDHLDINIVLEADDTEPLIITSESKDLRWVPLAELADYGIGAYMQRMLAKTKQLV